MTDTIVTDTFPIGVVLVLEDNPIIALDIEDTLQSIGAERVIMCRTCAEAFDSLSLVDVQFALLDVHLGNETSLDVANALRCARTPFMFVSASSAYGEAIFGMSDVEYLPKPFTALQLKTALSRVLSNMSVSAD